MMTTRRIEVGSGLCSGPVDSSNVSRLGSDILVDLRGGSEVVGDENCKGKGKEEDVLWVNEQNIKGGLVWHVQLSNECFVSFLGFFFWGNALAPKIVLKNNSDDRVIFFY